MLDSRQQNSNLYNPDILCQIGKIEMLTELGGHARHYYDVSVCAQKHACMLHFCVLRPLPLLNGVDQ